MRIRFLAPAITSGLIVGVGAIAAPPASAPPPSAPIFYCPSPAAAAAAHGGAQGAHAESAGCSTGRAAHGGGRGHGRVQVRHAEHGGGRFAEHGRGRFRVASRDEGDVSASQAFIYHYERAMHGLNPDVANHAWAEGARPPRPPRFGPPPHGPGFAGGPPDRMGPPPGDRGGYAYEEHRGGAWMDHHAGGHMLPPPVMAPPPEPGPPLPPPRVGPPAHMDGHMDHMGHMGHMGQMPPPPHGEGDYAYEERHGRREEARGHVDRHAWGDRRNGGRDYAYEEHGANGAGGHYGYAYERSEEHGDTGWRFSGGGGSSEHWGGAYGAGGHAGQGGAHSWSYGAGAGAGMAAGEALAGRGYREGAGEWRDGSYGHVYRYVSRDAQGYLVWPGKTAPNSVR